MTAVLGLCLGGVRGDDAPTKKPVEKTAAPKVVGPLSRADIDKAAGDAAHNAIELGVKLWQNENYEGTFRLFQGTLIGLEGILDHRPKLTALIKDSLDQTWKMKPEEGAFQLRRTLDAIQLETSGLGTLEKGPLWDRLGGEKKVKLIVHDFIAAAIKDPKVNFSRDGKYKLGDKLVARIEEQMVDLISVNMANGPLDYLGRDVPKIHAPMKITDAEYDAFVGHIADALKKNKVDAADANELVRKFREVKIYFVAK